MRNLRTKLVTLGSYTGLTALWVASVLWLPDGRYREIVTILWPLIVPGYVSWRALTGSAERITYKASGYIVGLSLLFLMLVGLALSQSYTFIGASRPLSRLPLTIAISGAVFILSLIAAARTTKMPERLSYQALLKKAKPVALTTSTIITGLLLPIVTILGATTLNNGGSAGLAIVALCAIAGLFMLLIIRERDLGKFYGYLLYCICVSILFATSMRGWNITGHDVMQEYQVFQLTLSHAAWHINYYHDAYTACLSITILPTILQKISGIAPQYIFKFVFQAVFAVIAAVMYGTLRVYASRRVSLLATFLFATFPTFMTDMAMLNRQEIALLFFALVMQVGTNTKLSKQLRSTLVFLFMVGMILSHYSTSYVTIGSLAAGLVIGLIWKVVDPSLRRSRTVNIAALNSIISPIVLFASLLVLIGWGAIATQTATNITQTVSAIVDEVDGGGVTVSSIVQSAPTTQQFSLQAIQTRILPASDYYLPSVVAKYPLQTAAETVAPQSSFARAMHLPEQLLGSVYDLMRSGYEALMIGCVGVGLLYCLLKRRTKTTPARQYLLAGAGIMVVAALQILLPSAINYGLTRILQQALVILALPAILAALWMLRLLRIPQHAAEIVIGTALVVFFLILSGAVPTITGGYKPGLTTANSGFYYAAYYTHQDEIAAAQWLEYKTPKGSQVYTDEFMRRKLITYGNIFSQPTLAPGAIPVDSYVMLSHGNLEFNQVAAYDGSDLIYYKPPTAFLQATKNLVYSSSDIQIYK